MADGAKPIREAYEGMSDDEVLRVMADSAERAATSVNATITVVKRRSVWPDATGRRPFCVS